MEYTHFVSVAALVYNQKDEVLLIKSPRRGWEYPGGMVEPGETFEQALNREIEEETGVKILIRSFAGISKNIQSDIVNIDFICEYTYGDLKTSDESLEVKWVKREEALSYITNPLTEKRLSNMLKLTSQMYCLSFTREPFEFVEDNWYEV